MNYVTSQSVNSDSDTRGGCGRDRRRRRRNRFEPGDAILRANTGSFGPATIPIVAPLLTAMVNEPIASVTIDTDQLDDPTILVQFLGTLTTTASTPVGLSFVFTLFRNCKFETRQQLKSFTVDQVIAAIGANIPDSRGLSFAFTENDAGCKDDCCTYTLELTRITATAPVTVNVTVNGTLSVLAVGEGEEER